MSHVASNEITVTSTQWQHSFLLDDAEMVKVKEAFEFYVEGGWDLEGTIATLLTQIEFS